MADLSNVEDAIVALVVEVLYPNGVAMTSAVGVTCRAYRGWPAPAALNSDLSAGVINITIFPAITPDEVPDCYLEMSYVPPPPTRLIASVTGDSVTFSGLVAVNQVAGVLVDGVPYSYRIRVGDTTGNVAANLAALVFGDRIAILSGSAITIPGAARLIARAVTDATVSRSLRRQRREVLLCTWCPSPALRDSVCGIIDRALATASFIDLSDGSTAHVQYVSTKVYDQSQSALLFRRDLCYKFEYSILDNTTGPVMLFGDLMRNGSKSYL
jgi:hypothetical protein